MTTTAGSAVGEMLSRASVHTAIEVALTILVLVALVERELLSAGGRRWRHSAQALNAVVVPLLIMFVVTMAARLATFL